MARIPKKSIGNKGEDAAVEFLCAHGYRVIDTNVRPMPGMERGEIDIVAWDSDTLCFVEVKTRRSARAEPAEAVDPRKRNQLARLAEAYLALHDLDDVPCRFDVVSVIDQPSQPTPAIRLVRDAFQPEQTSGATDCGDMGSNG